MVRHKFDPFHIAVVEVGINTKFLKNFKDLKLLLSAADLPASIPEV